MSISVGVLTCMIVKLHVVIIVKGFLFHHGNYSMNSARETRSHMTMRRYGSVPRMITLNDETASLLYCSDCCNRYHRSVRVIVRCLVLKQPDCMSLIVEASRSIFARDGPVLLKAVTTWQRRALHLTWELGMQWLYAECVLCVVCVPL